MTPITDRHATSALHLDQELSERRLFYDDTLAAPDFGSGVLTVDAVADRQFRELLGAVINGLAFFASGNHVELSSAEIPAPLGTQFVPLRR